MMIANPSPKPRAARAAYNRKMSLGPVMTALELTRLFWSLRRSHHIVREVHVAVGFRPQANPARHGFGKRMLQIELAVEIAFDLGAGNTNLKVVPLLAGCRGISNPGHRGAFALFELPENQIVFEAIRAQRQVVPIRFQIEQYAGALVDAAR